MDSNKNKAFACIVTQKGDIFWEKGIDNPHELYYKLPDKMEKFGNAYINIIPNDGDYCHLDFDKCSIIFQNGDQPRWWSHVEYEHCRKAFEEWKTWLYSIMDVNKLPQNPYFIKAPTIEQRHIDLLKTTPVKYQKPTEVYRVMIKSIYEKVSPTIWSYLLDFSEKNYFLDPISKKPNSSLSGIFSDILYIQIGYMFDIPFITYQYGEVKFPYMATIKLLQEGLVPFRIDDPSDGVRKGCLYGSPSGNGIAERLYTDDPKFMPLGSEI